MRPGLFVEHVVKGRNGDIPGFAPLSSRNQVGDGKRDAV